MKVTLEDAVSLLSKYAEERTPVLAVLGTPQCQSPELFWLSDREFAYGDFRDEESENSDRMRTGLLSDVAAVLQSLLILAQGKSLSSREKKMLERARYLLVSEIAISRHCEESLIEQALTKALTKCNLRFPEISELAS